MKFIGCSEMDGSKALIEVKANNKIWDLHNAAEFLGFSFFAGERKLILNFNYYIDYKESKTIKCRISLLGIGSWKVKPRDPEMPYSEDDCLSEIYIDKEIDSLRIVFGGGMVIEVNCDVFAFEIGEGVA